MLTNLIDEARAELDAASENKLAKFEEYMDAPFDGKDSERASAMDDAWRAAEYARGVLDGLKRAQMFLTAQERCSA